MPASILGRFRKYGVARASLYPVFAAISVRNVVVQRPKYLHPLGKKKKKGKNVKVVKQGMKMASERQLWGLYQSKDGMVDRQIFLDSFPLLFYDPRSQDVLRSVFPQLVFEPFGTGIKVSVRVVSQPIGESLSRSRDDMYDITKFRVNKLDRIDALDLASDYIVKVPCQIDLQKCNFVAYGALRSNRVLVRRKRYVLEMVSEQKVDAPLERSDQRLTFNLNPWQPGWARVFRIKVKGNK